MGGALTRTVGARGAVLAAVLAVGCGGDPGSSADGGADAGPPQEPPGLPELLPGEVLGVRSELVDPADGATIALSGATLEVPPGALGAEAQLGLVELAVPSAEFPADDGALGGEVLLRDTAFAVVADREVPLTQPLVLTVPYEAGRLPDGAQDDWLHMSAVLGGYVVPQRRPIEIDREAATLSIRLDPATLPRVDGGALPPMGAGATFLSVLSGLGLAGAAVSVLWGALPTVDGIKAAPLLDLATGFRELGSDGGHFVVRYRGVSEDEARGVADRLEDARALYEELAFRLPTLWASLVSYPVYIDDFANHVFNFDQPNADGMTIAGQAFWAGASYINTRPGRPEGLPIVAAHELFHAYQYGALTRFGTNAFEQILSSFNEISWLIEGCAVAIAGRVHFGGGVRAARDSTLGGHLAPRLSAWDPAQTPAYDVAQDFFYSLDARHGPGVYLPLHEGIEHELEGGVEPATASVATALRDLFDESLRDAWVAFVRDLLENPADYGSPNPEETENLDASGAPVARSLPMAPLSYTTLGYRVPRLDPDAMEEQSRDLEVAITVRGADAGLTRVMVKHGGGILDRAGFVDGVEEVIALPDARERTPLLTVALVHPSYERDAAVTVDVSVRIATPRPTGIIAYDVTDETGPDREYFVEVRDLERGTTWRIAPSAGFVSPRLEAMSRSGLLVVEEQRFEGNRQLAYEDFGRGPAHDPQRVCGMLGAPSVAVTPDGTLLLRGPDLAESGAYVYRYEPPSGTCTRLPIDVDGDDAIDDLGSGVMAIGSDAGDELFLVRPGDASLGDIVAVDTTSGAVRVIVSGGVHTEFLAPNHIAVSPRGQWLVYPGLVGTELVRFVVPASGGAPANLDARAGAAIREAAFLPDGRLFVIAQTDAETWPTRVGTLGISSGGFVEIAVPYRSISENRIAVSPDGRYVSYRTSGESDGSDLVYLRPDGSDFTNFTSSPGVRERGQIWR